VFRDLLELIRYSSKIDFAPLEQSTPCGCFSSQQQPEVSRKRRFDNDRGIALAGHVLILDLVGGSESWVSLSLTLSMVSKFSQLEI